MKMRDLIGLEAYNANVALHQGKGGFGGSGWRHAEEVFRYARKLRARTILDYGCGEGTLAANLRLKLDKYHMSIREYDPAVKGKDRLPQPAHMVTCTDVLEHVEPDKVDNVIKHIFEMALYGAYIAIATRPANKLLPDGRNAHLIVESPQWWAKKLPTTFIIERFDERKKGNGDPHEVVLWLRRAP